MVCLLSLSVAQQLFLGTCNYKICDNQSHIPGREGGTTIYGLYRYVSL